jgi:UDP-GlcNAc:undecaprenyl-phosphate GlcNAc-1-phosphate transferase
MLVSLTLAAIVFAYGAILLCRYLGLEDAPGGRKRHAGNIPLACGLSIVAPFLFAVLFLGVPAFGSAALTVLGGVFLLGLLDDRRHISPWLRLALHYLAGILLATWGGILIINVGNLLGMGDIPLLLLAVPLTALSFAGLANAYNMIDGVDGLAAGLAAVPLLVLLVLAYQAGHPQALTLVALLIPLAVFLCFNLGPDHPALPKMFLGDAGSVTLGFLVCTALVSLSQGENALIRPVAALWLVAVPLMDMLATMLRRVRGGHSPMAADRMHLHHILLHDMGLAPRETTAVLVTYAILCAVLGMALETVPPYLSLLLYFILFLAHCLLALRAETIGERVRRLLGRVDTDRHPGGG